ADLTPYLKYGEENTVLVKVSNGNIPNSRWYTGSGSCRPVYLLNGGAIRIAPDGLRITTPEASTDISLVETDVKIVYDGKVTKKIYVCTEIKDQQGKVVASESTPVTLYAGKVPSIHQKIYVRNAKLWSVEAPNLYSCEVKLMMGEEILDEAVSSFGIRHIQFDPMYGLRINGEKVLLRGACIHHDNGVIGACSFPWAEERRVAKLKEAGFNSIRVSHNSAPKSLLDACDSLGMLVVEESFDMWNNSKNPYDYALDFAQSWEKDVEAIVAKDFNHPSVLMYCIGNEIQELGTPAGARWNRELADKFRKLDPTRPVTNAVNGLMTIMDKMIPVMIDLGMITQEQLAAMQDDSAEKKQGGDINDAMTALMGQMNYITSHPLVGQKLEETYGGLDICGLNYMRDSYAPILKNYPNRIVYGSETLPPDIDLNWKLVKELPGCIGDYTWTGWDYIGESGVGIAKYNGEFGFFSPYPAYLAYVGDIDIVGNRRPMSYYREIVYGLRSKPYIAVQYPQHYNDKKFMTPWITEDSLESWTWPGYENKPVKVEVYSADEEVELFLNGESLGKLATGEIHRFKAVFDTIYKPGRLEAVSYTNGIEKERFEIRTAGSGLKLKALIDKNVLKSGGLDLSYIMFALTDEDGRLNAAVDRKVRVAVEGAGTLQGFGSADPKSTENCYDTERTTFNGQVLAVVRAGMEKGEIHITASCEGCENVSIKLQVE
ncbi:MAG: glycoside hydrolase, partial [Clostridiales bacterium]|nr:glycoside hydrolase [Clostridiales bacterium]